MNKQTQTVRGLGVAHFSGGTPKVGGWEYFPGPTGVKVLTPREWHGAEKGLFAKGRGTQAWIPQKNKGIQTMPATEEDRTKWADEWKKEEAKMLVNTESVGWNLKTVEIKKQINNKDRYREWIIRSRMRIRNEKDEEVIWAEEKLQEWCAEREREWWAAEVVGEDLDKNEIDDILDAVTPPALLDPLPDEVEAVSEADLLEDLLKDFQREREETPAIPPRKKPLIVKYEVFKIPPAEWRHIVKGPLGAGK